MAEMIVSLVVSAVLQPAAPSRVLGKSRKRKVSLAEGTLAGGRSMKKTFHPTRRRAASMENTMIRLDHAVNGTGFKMLGWNQASFVHGINGMSGWL